MSSLEILKTVMNLPEQCISRLVWVDGPHAQDSTCELPPKKKATEQALFVFPHELAASSVAGQQIRQYWRTGHVLTL